MLIAGNWKMFKGPHEARVFASTIRGLAELVHGVDVVVCPPAVSLAAAVQGLGTGSEVRVYAQNVHWELEGAFTGEISAPMVLEAGVHGHDRRPLGAPAVLRGDGRDGAHARGNRARAGTFRDRVRRRDGG